MNKFLCVVVPLSIMLLLATLAMLGLGANTPDFSDGFTLYDVNTSTDIDGNLLLLYDTTGSATCLWNGTAINGDNGIIIKNAYTPDAVWRNGSGAYALFYDVAHTNPVKFADCTSVIGFMQGSQIKDSARSFTIADSLSWLVIVAVIMGLGSLAGLKFFGTGLSEISVKVLLVGTFAITLWSMLTVMCYPLFIEGGFYMFILYGAMALFYTIGVVLTMAGD